MNWFKNFFKKEETLDNLTINIKLFDGGILPSKIHKTDACYDCYVRDVKVQEKYIQYFLGFATEIPEGWCALIFPRSSISNYSLSLSNAVGVVDSSFRGEWQVKFKPAYSFDVVNNTSSANDFHVNQYTVYNVGDRVCQFMLVPVMDIRLNQVKELTNTKRGVGGFGSTGK